MPADDGQNIEDLVRVLLPIFREIGRRNPIMPRFIHYVDLRESDVMQFRDAEAYLSTSPYPTVFGAMRNDGLHPNLSLLKHVQEGCANVEKAFRLAVTPKYLGPALNALVPPDWAAVGLALAEGIAVQVGLLGASVALGAAGGFVSTAWTGVGAPAGAAAGAAVGFFLGNLLLNGMGLYDTARATLTGAASEEHRIRGAIRAAWIARAEAELNIAAFNLALSIAVIVVLALLAAVAAVLKKTSAALRKSLGPRIRELSGRWAHRRDSGRHDDFLRKVTRMWDESEARYHHDWRSRIPAGTTVSDFERIAARAGMRPFHLADWSNLSRNRRWLCVLRCGKPGALDPAHLSEFRTAKSVLVKLKTSSRTGLVHLSDQGAYGFRPGMSRKEADELLEKLIAEQHAAHPWARRGKFRWEKNSSGELVLTEDGKFVVADYDKMGIYRMEDSGGLRPHPDWASDPMANDSPENQAFINRQVRGGQSMDQHGCQDFSRGPDGRPLRLPDPDEDFVVLTPPNGHAQIIHGAEALRTLYARYNLPWPY